jgi:hypothetical protein
VLGDIDGEKHGGNGTGDAAGRDDQCNPRVDRQPSGQPIAQAMLTELWEYAREPDGFLGRG